jgi:alpha-beta hydrolase superfamily lysophospholipase
VRPSLLVVILVLVGLKLLVMWLEPRMAFYPIRGVQATPAAMSLSYADLRIKTEDGETLHAWWLEHPKPRGQVLFFHGNGGNLSLWLDVIAELRRRGFSVLAVDYRGYGESSGSSNERGLYRDAKATAQEFAQRLRRSDVPVIYWGRSIGCPVAASAISIERPDAVVLESPMPDVRTILRTNPLLWLLSFFSSYRFNTPHHLAGYQGPLLVIHGDRDSIVPFSAGRRVFESAPTANKTFVTIAGADHNDLHVVNPGLYWAAIDAFVASIGTGSGRRQ